MANDKWCRHFTGTQYVVCEAGVTYADVRYEPPQGMYRFPCTAPEHRHLCPLFAPYTAEEIAAFNAEIAAMIGKTNDFANGVSKVCPECGNAFHQAAASGDLNALRQAAERLRQVQKEEQDEPATPYSRE